MTTVETVVRCKTGEEKKEGTRRQSRSKVNQVTLQRKWKRKQEEATASDTGNGRRERTSRQRNSTRDAVERKGGKGKTGKWKTQGPE